MKTKEKQIKKRRPKGMGSITNLGKGRERPFMASVSDSPIGYAKDYKGAELLLLHHFLKLNHYVPANVLGNKMLEQLHTEYVYNLQAEGKINKNINHTSTSIIEDYNDLFILKCDKLKVTKPSMDIDITNNSPSFKDVWEKVYYSEICDKSESTQVNYKSAFNKFHSIHDIRIDRIRTGDLQEIFDQLSEKGLRACTLNILRIVCRAIFEYAIRYEYTNTDYSKYIKIKESNNAPTKINKPFTDNEIHILLEDNTYDAKIILCYIFTGMRPIELINLKKSNIDLDHKIMIGGQKTINGKDRIIPIHNTILPIIQELYDYENGNNLFYSKYNSQYAYNLYRTKIFQPSMKRLSLDHSEPYDTRHTFADLCFYNGVDEYAKKKIMGHSIKDLTLRVYTTATCEFLLQEINKIKVASDL